MIGIKDVFSPEAQSFNTYEPLMVAMYGVEDEPGTGWSSSKEALDEWQTHYGFCSGECLLFLKETYSPEGPSPSIIVEKYNGFEEYEVEYEVFLAIVAKSCFGETIADAADLRHYREGRSMFGPGWPSFSDRLDGECLSMAEIKNLRRDDSVDDGCLTSSLFRHGDDSTVDVTFTDPNGEGWRFTASWPETPRMTDLGVIQIARGFLGFAPYMELITASREKVLVLRPVMA